jgi:hypothetical protein
MVMKSVPVLRGIPHKRGVPSIFLVKTGGRDGRKGGMHGDMGVEAAGIFEPGDRPQVGDSPKDGEEVFAEESVSGVSGGEAHIGS